MYAVVMASIDMSHDSWSRSSNIIRKVLMQLLSTIRVHCTIKSMIAMPVPFILNWGNDKLFLYLCPFYRSAWSDLD
jgi:hypothetical protein